MPEKLTTKRVLTLIGAGKPGDFRDAAARGLVLRVKGPTSHSWTVRRSWQDRDMRIDLGGEWSLEEARDLAGEIDRRVRAKSEPWFRGARSWQEFLENRKRAKLGLGPAISEPEIEKVNPFGVTHTWEQAIELWHAELLRTRRKSTANGYRNNLKVKEMRRFEGRRVSEITLPEIAEAVAEIHVRAERQANITAVNVRGLFAFLGRDDKSRLSGVEKGRMKDLECPEDSLTEGPTDGANTLFVPDGPVVGHLVRALRDPASPIPERDRLACLLVVFTAQRRRPVAIARKSEFESVPGLGGLWKIPPLHRKTASQKARRGVSVGDHVIPLPPPAWAVVKRAMELAGDSEWLFPAERGRRADVPATSMSESTITHRFAEIAGNAASPHDIRRAFGTTYGQVADLEDHQVKMILDHSEGVASGDVTREHYMFTTGEHKKWPVMDGYVGWVDKWAATKD